MNRPNVIFLGFTIPDDIAQQYFKLDPNAAIQTHKFAWSFARALSLHYDTTLVSSVPIQNYPLVNKILIKGASFTQDNIHGIITPFINLLLLKHLTRFYVCFFILLKAYFTKKPSIIFIHGLHTPYLALGNIFKLLDVKIAVILTDPSGIELDTDSLLAKKLKRLDKRVTKLLTRKADILIGLAPKLIEDINNDVIKLVFPGILNKDFSNEIKNARVKQKNIDVVKDKCFKVVYAGGLHDVYGIKTLTDAILTFDKNVNIEMLFLGKGNQLDYIKEMSILDSRIEYGGFLNGSELITRIQEADLLINPRPTLLDFSSHSFPSKLIEYLATGIPVLTTRIASIPHDLEQLFYYIDDESKAGIQQAIVSVMTEEPKQRYLKALKAKNYIEKAYSEEAIAEKINHIVKQL